MLIFSLCSLLLAFSAHASDSPEKVAEADAKRTFLEFQRSAAKLDQQVWDSLTRFRERKDALKRNFDAYCESMEVYPKIHGSCVALAKSEKELLEKKDHAIENEKKPDAYGDLVKQMERLFERANELQWDSPENDKRTLADFQKFADGVNSDFAKLCAGTKDPDFSPRCQGTSEMARDEMANEITSRKRRALPQTPEKEDRRKFTDTTPILRCAAMPPALDPPGEYELTDQLGAYRYSHMRKHKNGYEFEIPLSELEKANPSHFFAVSKMYSDSAHEAKYIAEIGTVSSCAPDGASPPHCVNNSFSVRLQYQHGSEKEIAADATFPLVKDIPFSLALAQGNPFHQNFYMSCAIASKMRKGGWAFSDSMIEEGQ